MQEIPHVPAKSKWIKLTIILAALAVCAGVVIFILYKISEEQKARRTVEAYLETLKSGVGNQFETVDLGKVGVEDVIPNVLEYKYLATLRKERVPDKPMVHDREMYDEVYKKIYKSFDEYLDEMMKLYGAQARREGDRVIVDKGTSHYEFSFLYDLVITDWQGQRLYRKYVFAVEPTSIGNYSYKITAILRR